jgi:chromosome partitioning protein
VNLAAALAERGQRVLLLDLDPQASASAWCGVSHEGRGLADVFGGDKVHVADLAHDTAIPHLAVVPASPWLMTVEKTIAGEVGAETLLRRAVTTLPPRWDWALIDCPPSLGFLSLSALVACADALVPVEAHTMALAGLAALRQTIDRVRERLNPELAILAILACRVDGRTNLSRDIVARLREWGGPLMLDTVIRENVRLAEAPSFHQPITVYAPSSSGAEDYRAAAAELLARTKRSRRR